MVLFALVPGAEPGRLALAGGDGLGPHGRTFRISDFGIQFMASRGDQTYSIRCPSVGGFKRCCGVRLSAEEKVISETVDVLMTTTIEKSLSIIRQYQVSGYIRGASQAHPAITFQLTIS